MKVLKYIGIIFYVVLIIISTFFLFTFNQFSSSQIGNVTITGLKKDIASFSKGSLLIAKKDAASVKEGNKIIYYDTNHGRNQLAVIEVESVMKTNDKEYTYVIQDGLFLSSEYFIGTIDDVKEIPYLGYLYSLFTSKLGYLIFIILPIIVTFIFYIKKYKRSIHAQNKN